MVGVGSSEMGCRVEVGRTFDIHTIKVEVFLNFLPWQGDLIHLEYFVNFGILFDLLKYPYETTLVAISELFHLTEEYFWQAGWLTMFLGDY